MKATKEKRFPAPASAQSVAATTATPTLGERLDRLTTEIDRNRIDLHVPGLALAIVRGDEVIFARGFGLATETGDVLQTQLTMWFPEAGAIPVTTTYSDYREVERVEVGVTLAPDTFTLQPSTGSGRGK